MTIEATTSPQLEALSFDPLSGEVPVDAWQELCRDALDPNPFFDPAFLRPFLEHMPGRKAGLVVVRNGETGTWLMAAPIGRRRLGLAVPVHATWATDYSPLGTPLMHPDADGEAARRFFAKAAGPGKMLAIPHLPLGSETAARLTGLQGPQMAVAGKSERASHAAGEEGKAQFEEAFSGKRRKEMRRLLRRLGDHGETRFESVTGAAAIEGFETFLELEASGWKGRNGTALVSQPPSAQFSREAVRRLAEGPGLRIDQLWSGDRLIAALVLFQEAGHVFSWKIAFDETYARYSPGAQIALQAFRENLVLPGFKSADSLAIPGHSMIEPLWRGRLETGTLLMAGGALGRLKLALCKADLAVEHQTRLLARDIKKRLKP